ncbi:MAG: efflux RND transporter periplasmic adaptor subunit [Deltaproteobacteria bacterium]|nr:efflux RND transporter periplasmic adaptor subunit [Deltaproteobacteria bacterium]
METARPRPSPFTRTLSLNGTLDARDSVQVAAQVEGPITGVRVDLGDRVERGQVLARIVVSDVRARAQQFDAELAQARADLSRLEQLARTGDTTPAELERARTKIAVLRAQRAQTVVDLRDSTVRAPFAGAIARRHVAQGAYVRPGTPLFDLVAVDPLRLALEVPERYAPSVRVGDVVRVAPEVAVGRASPSDQGLAAPIVRIAPVVDPARRTFRIEAEVPAGAGALRPGMFVVGTIALGEVAGALRVPRQAVVTVLGRPRVVLVVDGRATPREIEMLGEEGADAIVLGVAPTDVVVTRGAGTLAPGAPVRASSEPPPTAAAEAPPTGAR